MSINNFVVFILSMCLSPLIFANEKISLDQVVDVVSERNYQVLESAEKVYQSRAEIAVARGNLIPKLNFWTIIKTIINPASLIDSLLSGDSGIAPFMVPNNWFRLKESQILFDAEREAYRGVWSNEVMNAKSLYVNLLLDQELYLLINRHVDEVEKVYKIAKTKEALGSIPVGLAQELEIRWLKLQDDKNVLEKLLVDEYQSLTYALGLPFSDKITIENIDVPDIKNLEPLIYSDFEFRAIDSSPEKRQLNHLLRVIPYLKKEVRYSFFGNSRASRGVSGGIFDGLPIPDGFGVGNGASISVIEGTENIFKLQRAGVIETIKRQLNSVINTYNSSIERYGNLERRLELADSRLKQYLGRMQIGENIDLLDLTDAYHRSVFEKMNLFTLSYNFVVNKDKFHRLIIHGDYKKSKDSLKKIDEERKVYFEEQERLKALEEKQRRNKDKRRRP